MIVVVNLNQIQVRAISAVGSLEEVSSRLKHMPGNADGFLKRHLRAFIHFLGP